MEEREEIRLFHERYIRGLFYYLQHDEGSGVTDWLREEISRWHLPADEYERYGHFSPQLYVRSGRRMAQGEAIATEAMVLGQRPTKEPAFFGSYPPDQHL